jgi:effector-binding domain-containing protein
MEIELKEKPSQLVLYIRTRTSLDKLPQLIGGSYMKIANYLCSLGEQPMGVPYTAYYNLDMQNLDVEMGFPVTKALPETEEIKTREIETQQVVSTMHQGPYAKMEPTYIELFKWIEENGYHPTGVCYEYYHNSPEEVPESELLTEIVLPIK